MHLSLFLLCLMAMSGFVQVPSNESPRITTVHQAKFLPPEAAAKGLTVELEGVVTCVPDGWKGFFLSDDTCGVYCEAQDEEAEKTFWPVAVGEKIALKGVTKEGHRNSFVQVQRVTSRSIGNLPIPALSSAPEMIRSLKAIDADFVRLRGIMVRIVNIANEMEYGLISGGVECDVVHSGFRVDPKLTDYTEVEVCGVVIPIESRNTFKMIVPNRDSFRIISSQKEVYDSTPRDTLQSVLNSPFPSPSGLIRFEADVFSKNHGSTWLVDKSFGIESVGQLKSVEPKDRRVELIGFVRTKGVRKWIEFAEILGYRPGEELEFQPKSPSEMANVSTLNRLISSRGVLVDRHTIDGRKFKTFESSSGRFSALVLEHSTQDDTKDFAIGASYRVSGLVTAPTGKWEDRLLVVRSYDDIQFASPPPMSPHVKFLFASSLSALLALGLSVSTIAYRQLRKTKLHLDQARIELRRANEALEKKVELRTDELRQTSESLSDESWGRIQAEQEKAIVEARLEDAKSLAELGSIYWDAVSDQSVWSKKTYQIHGLNPAARSPSFIDYLDYIIKEERESFREYLHRVIASRERRAIRYRIETTTGAQRWVQAIARAVRSANGIVIGIEAVLQEITESVIAEEQLRQSLKMEAIGRLAGGIAHDLNNTLTVIQTSCYCLQQPVATETERLAHLSAIQCASEQSGNLTKQLIAYGRKQVVRPVQLNINQSIRGFEPLARRLLGDSVRLVQSLDKKIDNAKLDPSQFEQILMNLLINARDSMTEGGEIVVETRMTTIDGSVPTQSWSLAPGHGDYVTLSVRDMGAGIANDIVEKIFEPYFTTKPSDRGTGLGLAVVHGIVKQNGGGILVSRVLPNGTTFQILLPTWDGTRDGNVSVVPAGLKFPLQEANKSILLVDDEPIVLKMTKSILVSQGYKVSAYVSPEQALEAAIATEFDLLLTDISMPEMHGCALAKSIQQYRPNIAVVFMSGFLNDNDSTEFAVGVDARFLQKPFAMTALFETICASLDDARVAVAIKVLPVVVETASVQDR